ncbi:hypothetical protein MESS2_1650002 [Mesorhizobium metallidurans STM 2683]|uniref:Uncharacterized protein n=1 Tax=Mesorhizobium metallidurans STM 2683 TaxID=1297569 RepID=M5ELV0_9HYPH|nr:hypothetical protein MESS2_1650002 [Mesorhizobium metallidurans STM 2683]
MFSALLIALDEFVETAGFSVTGLGLIQKGQIILIEYPEELIPFDRLECFLGLAEVDPQDAALAFRADHRRPAIPLLGPFANFVMVSGRLRLRH